MLKKLIYILFFLSFQLLVFSGNADKGKSTTRVIAGKISDASGEAIAGAKIIVKETGETFFADLDGNFKLNLKKDKTYLLAIQTIGFQPKEIKSSELSPFSEVTLSGL